MRRLALLFPLLACAALAGPAAVAQGPPPDPASVQAGTQAETEARTENAASPGDSADGGTSAGWPAWSERWLFNADERTRRGRAAAADRAVERFDTALRLRPDDPTTRYNAGTARLRDQRPGARELLEAAANEASEARVRSRAQYNLGNARLEASDLPGAVEAYEEALRADPSFGDAKHNLEVALRRLEQQQNQDQQQEQNNRDQQQEQNNQDQQQEQNQDQQQDQRQDQQQQDEQQQEDQQEQDQQQGGQEEERQDQPPEDGEGQGQGQPQESPNERRPLPQFQDLPDMSAEEAATILEAIENMEREERRRQALEAARKAQASGKKDW